MSAWSKQDLETLRRIRTGYLEGNAGASDYWRETRDLELYDATFAQRIGWKWDAVLGELELRRWGTGARRVVDLGCGTGMASRRVLAHWPGHFGEVTLVDRSALARGFAARKVREHPEVRVRERGPGDWEADCEGALVLLSHVLTELGEPELERWMGRLRKAAAILWVESATYAASRRLVERVREPASGWPGWRVVAPCIHGQGCAMLRQEHERHWCHHFARVPSEVHQDAALGELAEELGLDLRVLPYSFLVLDRGIPGEPEGGAARVIGRARELKGHLRVLSCERSGLHDRVLQKRDVPGVFKALRKEQGVPLYRWDLREERIVGGERLYEGEA